MAMGLMVDERTFDSYQRFRQWVETLDAGFDRLWIGQHQSWDALTLLALAGQLRPDLSFGSAIAVTYPFHPVAMASKALTTQAATGNRLTLGIGVSHRPVIDGVFGLSADRPVRHLREYLAILAPLLRGESVDYQGETVSASGAIAAPGATAPRLLVAALGPAMLRLAGALADGTVLSWATPSAIEKHVLPIISAAASEAGRPTPHVVATIPVCVTDDERATRAWVRDRFAAVASLPNYGNMLSRGSAQGVEDAVAVGPLASVERQLHQLAEAGATEIVAMPIGTAEQQATTCAALASVRTCR